MEELLNKLIEKGWKPRGKNAYNCCDNAKRIWYEWWEESYRDYIEITPRKLTSKESWLWQFVCENKLIKEGYKHERILDPTFGEWWADCKRQEHDWKYWYRLIESALKDESELEQFLLDNIKV